MDVQCLDNLSSEMLDTLYSFGMPHHPTLVSERALGAPPPAPECLRVPMAPARVLDGVVGEGVAEALQLAVVPVAE